MRAGIQRQRRDLLLRHDLTETGRPTLQRSITVHGDHLDACLAVVRLGVPPSFVDRPETAPHLDSDGCATANGDGRRHGGHRTATAHAHHLAGGVANIGGKPLGVHERR